MFAAFLILLTLKLTGVAAISWFWVLLPITPHIALAIFMLLAILTE